MLKARLIKEVAVFDRRILNGSGSGHEMAKPDNRNFA